MAIKKLLFGKRNYKFMLIGILTIFYLNSIKPTIIKGKTSNHINVLNNTIENINRLNIKFNEYEIAKNLMNLYNEL